jgi:hypothetical protein
MLRLCFPPTQSQADGKVNGAGQRRGGAPSARRRGRTSDGAPVLSRGRAAVDAAALRPRKDSPVRKHRQAEDVRVRQEPAALRSARRRRSVTPVNVPARSVARQVRSRIDRGGGQAPPTRAQSAPASPSRRARNPSPQNATRSGRSRISARWRRVPPPATSSGRCSCSCTPSSVPPTDRQGGQVARRGCRWVCPQDPPILPTRRGAVGRDEQSWLVPAKIPPESRNRGQGTHHEWRLRVGQTGQGRRPVHTRRRSTSGPAYSTGIHRARELRVEQEHGRNPAFSDSPLHGSAMDACKWPPRAFPPAPGPALGSTAIADTVTAVTLVAMKRPRRPSARRRRSNGGAP